MKRKFEGVQAAAELLNHLDPERRARILSEMEARDPLLTAEVQRRVFGFEDLARIGDSSIQILLKEVPRDRLALAMRQVTPEFRSVVLKNLPSRAATILLEEIDALGPRRLSEVRKAQAEILEFAKRLAASRKIDLG